MKPISSITTPAIRTIILVLWCRWVSHSQRYRKGKIQYKHSCIPQMLVLRRDRNRDTSRSGFGFSKHVANLFPWFGRDIYKSRGLDLPPVGSYRRPIMLWDSGNQAYTCVCTLYTCLCIIISPEQLAKV